MITLQLGISSSDITEFNDPDTLLKIIQQLKLPLLPIYNWDGKKNRNNLPLNAIQIGTPYQRNSFIIDFSEDLNISDILNRLNRVYNFWSGVNWSRRAAIITFGVAPVIAGLACTMENSNGGETIPLDTSGESLTAEEISNLDSIGALEIPDYDFGNLSPNARTLLIESLITRGASSELGAYWRKVATPAFLKDANIGVGDELSNVFRVRNTNGGFNIFIPEHKLWLKMTPKNSNQALLLQQSYPTWRNAWTAAGMPEEMIGNINYLDSFFYEGTEYVALSSPHTNPGLTLEKALKRGIISADQVLPLLEKYFLEVIINMNNQGSLQIDFNFQNIVLHGEPGNYKLIPIDLDNVPRLVQSGLVSQYEYERLATRALKRGIQMKSYEEFAQIHRLDAPSILQSDRIFGLNITINGQRTKVLIPKSLVDGKSEAHFSEILDQIEKGITSQIKSTEQGGLMEIKIITEGIETNIPVLKTATVGERILPYGGRLGQLLRAGKQGLRLASDLLFVWWAADEAINLTTPDKSIDLRSKVTIETNAISTGSTTATGWPEQIFNTTMEAKESFAQNAVSTPFKKPEHELVGISPEDIAKLASLGVNQGQVYDSILKDLRSSLIPLMPVNIRFESQIPFLFQGETKPTSAAISALKDGEMELLVFWLKDTLGNSENLVPAGIFYRESKNVQEWMFNNLLNATWSMSFEVMGGNTFLCQIDQNGDHFTFNCSLTDSGGN